MSIHRVASARPRGGRKVVDAMQQLKLVVRFRDGRVLKGTTENFNPLTGGFHLVPAAPAPPQPVAVRLCELKAVFVVHEFHGKPGRVEKKNFNAKETGQGARLRVTFDDGEVLVGSTLNSDPKSAGFFLFPADPNSNNQRVYVLNAAVKDVRQVA